MTMPHPALARPSRIVLDGRYVRLEPLALAHLDGLWAASTEADGRERYRWLYDEPPQNREVLAAWIGWAARSDDPLYYAIVDQSSGEAVGRQSYLRITPNDGVIEVGGVFWGPRMARTRLATEALYLSARYAFETLGNRRFEWKCNNRNEPSKRAAERFGFTFEGIFRQHAIQKGENRDTAWFAMLDGEWPSRKAGFEAWLDPENFDAEGRQKMKLAFAG
jgi:RimJ/RimL family protein N-acetyltransferase